MVARFLPLLSALPTYGTVHCSETLALLHSLLLHFLSCRGKFTLAPLEICALVLGSSMITVEVMLYDF